MAGKNQPLGRRRLSALCAARGLAGTDSRSGRGAWEAGGGGAPRFHFQERRLRPLRTGKKKKLHGRSLKHCAGLYRSANYEIKWLVL